MSMLGLAGKVVLVTGGSRGLGRSLVEGFAGEGASVAFTCRGGDGAAEELRGRLAGEGARVLAFRADVADFDGAHSVVREIESEWGWPDVLVCNAGIARGAAVWRMSEDDWDSVIAVTLKGCFNYAHAVTDGFMRRGSGKILCVGSINGLRGRVGTLGYNVAKAGVTGLVKTLAAELGRFNVNVNAIAPGFIETESQERTPELIRDLVLKECAIKRLGMPEDIVPLVLFLCSEGARHITGQTILIDAGQYL